MVSELGLEKATTNHTKPRWEALEMEFGDGSQKDKGYWRVLM